MKFIIKKNTSKLTTIAVAFQAGSCLELQKNYKMGTAHFLEHFLFKGTAKRNSFEMSREIAFYGGESNAYTSSEHVTFYINIPIDHIEAGIEILHDMITNPIFPEAEFEKEKQVILEEFASRGDSVGNVIHEKLSEAFYSNYLARPVIGTEESINSITLDDVKRFYAEFYKKENMLISVCSSLKPATTEALLEKYFGKQDGIVNFLLTPESTRVKKTKIVNIIRADLEQNHVVWAWPAFRHSSKDKFAAGMLASILGDGMDSRLFQEVREKANLVYGIGCGASADRTGGDFCIQFSTRPQNVEKAKDIILAEIAKIVGTPPTEEELQRAKNKGMTSIYRSWQSNDGVAMKVVGSFMMGKKVTSVSSSSRKLSKVTVDDVTRVARKIFSGKNVMVVAKKEA